ncbi:MAG TPA: uracil-DNA glycosylase [Anaerolineales bacterium]|nr:uracil-DNA glycosylase [Anaerolineales bacterium]
MEFDTLDRKIIGCRQCARLVSWRETVGTVRRKAFRESAYWSKPVPGCGDRRARILAVGLAPGAHGSNRTGRQFTGDASGRFLFPALHRAGLANRPDSVAREDGLRLRGLYLTALCRCVPPANKPSPGEILNCRPYLQAEIDLLAPSVIVCLGRLAFENVLKMHALRPSACPFKHGASYKVAVASPVRQRWLLCSFHPSQQNTFTGKLTPAMFDRIWENARELAQLEHG